jgi:PadR family transcriptional regulator PadR
MSETLGEFEHLVLLAILQLGRDAQAARVRELLEERASRKVTRGALYATLERLASKDLLSWEVEQSTPARGGIPGRRFHVTSKGVEAVRRSHAAVSALTRGLEGMIGET